MDGDGDGDGQLKNLAKVWTIAIAFISYSYCVASRIPKGVPRLLALFPVLCVFLFLPLNLHYVHFCGPTAFFLTWLGNFKLLLLAFDLGPLASPLPSFFRFAAILCLPIKIKKELSPEKPTGEDPPLRNRRALRFAAKVLLLAINVRLYEYKERFDPRIVHIMYCLNLYFGEEILLALCSLPARAIVGAPLEQQFDEPYLSTSLQDFWGRRWNLMVPNILRLTVYDPTRYVTSRTLGPKWAQFLAMIASFTVSGLMHELIYYYFTRVAPTWEVTSFFVLHGICNGAEVAVKAAVAGKVQLHRGVSGPLTLAFLIWTAKLLLFPQLIRNGVVDRTIGEYSILVNFVKAKIGSSS